ncbi:uncharacterized protein LOC113999980 [Pipra filicauda]|uniref:Uncharacterized protein LOC113999980 n=1 Tax=Pipra filicauda TaxID=649802 RepID=A0A6J2IIU6_9PASS|nr:uncharacterized protein LOC113999980 [Pipra filicauda]
MLEQGLRHFGAGRGLSSPPPPACLQAVGEDTGRPGQGAGRCGVGATSARPSLQAPGAGKPHARGRAKSPSVCLAMSEKTGTERGVRDMSAAGQAGRTCPGWGPAAKPTPAGVTGPGTAGGGGMISIYNVGEAHSLSKSFSWALLQTDFKSTPSNRWQPMGPRSCPCKAPWHPPGGTCACLNGPWCLLRREKGSEERKKSRCICFCTRLDNPKCFVMLKAINKVPSEAFRIKDWLV